MKMKEESERAGLKLTSQRTQIMASGPITSLQIDGEKMETMTYFIFLDSWESQFLGRLIESLGYPRRREGSRALKEKRTNMGFFFFSTFLSLSHIKCFFSLSQELMITQQTTQFKICTKAMAPHSSTLAWRIPWTEEPGGLQSTGSQTVGHDWVT